MDTTQLTPGTQVNEASSIPLVVWRRVARSDPAAGYGMIAIRTRRGHKGVRRLGLTRAGRSFLALACLLAVPSAVDALERPTPEQISRYRADGSLEGRISRAFQLGNHQVKPGLVATRTTACRWSSGGRASSSSGRRRLRLERHAHDGHRKILALLIAFSDYARPANTSASIDAKLLGDGAGGLPLREPPQLLPPLLLQPARARGGDARLVHAAYPRSSVPQTTAGRESLIKEALDSFNAAGHDFSQYDNDGDGEIDYFVVIWTGPDNGWANFWWGYQTGFSDGSLPARRQAPRQATRGSGSRKPTGGRLRRRYVVIHETGHALGLPDYYDYDDTVGPRGGVGGLDMMDANRGDHNCFSKFLLDWMTPDRGRRAA